MTSLRSYGDPCGIARALDLVGERWALLVVRELLFGPKRFTELTSGLPGASPNVLSQRLRELEGAGVVRRHTTGAAYELTDFGRDLQPILVALGRWGARSASPPRGALGVDALMVALEATFVAGAAAELRATYELRLADQRFVLEIDRGAIAIRRGTARAPGAVIETDAATLRALVFGDRRPAGAPVTIGGDRRLARRLFRLFRRPAPAARRRQRGTR